MQRSAEGMGVATERVRGSERDLPQLLVWLDEQRRQDHDRLVQLARIVEEQRDELRDHSTALATLRSNGAAKPAVEPRAVESGAPRPAEQLVLIERALDDHIETQSRAAQADAALRDRERRTIAELVQQAEALGRALEGVTGRLQALSEEIRHEREARVPFFQSLDDLGRTQTGLVSRISSLEQTVRRATSAQSAMEQSSEKQAADLARIDNQLKLQDLRYTREILEIRRSVDEWRLRADEQLKPIEAVSRQFAQLAEQREAVATRLEALDQGFAEVVSELNRLESTTKADRVAIERVADALEAYLRRWEATGGSIWQLGERLTTVVDDLAVLRGEERALQEEVAGFVSRLDRCEDECRRLENAAAESFTQIRLVEREAQACSDGAHARLDAEVSSLTDRANARYRLAVDHLRRIVEELQQQQRELDLGAS
jgi:chromosome segregation ATPase